MKKANVANKDEGKLKIIEETLLELKTNKKILENVWKWLNSEDEVKILAFEWIEEMIDNFITADSDEVEDEGEAKLSTPMKEKSTKHNSSSK